MLTTTISVRPLTTVGTIKQDLDPAHGYTLGAALQELGEFFSSEAGQGLYMVSIQVRDDPEDGTSYLETIVEGVDPDSF